MKIAVIGAGAIGCYYGGVLAQAGHEVRLIGRAHHVEAIERDGLLLETDSGKASISLHATTDADGVRDTGLVLCCVKSADTARAAEVMVPHLAANAIIVSLQNGIDNSSVLRARVVQEIIPAVIYVGAGMVGDGHVRYHGGGEVVLGDTLNDQWVAAILKSAGIPVEISSNIEGEQWTKLVVNCAYNALSAITTLPYGKLVEQEGVVRVLRDVVDECLAVAERMGIKPSGDVWQNVEHIPKNMPGQISSTALDLRRGHATEIDYLNGAIVRRGEEFGVPVPANRLLHTLVKALESRAVPT